MIASERPFPRAIESLGDLFAFTSEFFAAEGIEREHRFAMELALEELFTNVVKYNPRGTPVLVRLEHDGNRLTLQLVDDDAEPFDITRARPAQVDLPLAEREPGGLGLDLVRNFVDRVEFEHADRRSTIRVTRIIDDGAQHIVRRSG